MPDVELVDIGPGGAPWERLLGEIARRDARLLGVVPALRRVFAVRSPWAPGLVFVGGETLAAEGAGEVFHVAGAALSWEDALAACLGEAAERLSQVEQEGDVVAVQAVEAGDHDMDAATETLALKLLAANCQARDRIVEWIAARRIADDATLLPADWCLRRRADGPLRRPGAPLSLGCAAGPTLAAAAASAALELIERDAASFWWRGERAPLALPCDVVRRAEDTMLPALRREAAVRTTRLLGISSALGAPVVAAVSWDGEGRNVAIGTAARSRTEDAARAAILELCQMEIGLQVADLKRRARSDAALSETDRRHLDRASRLHRSDPRFHARADTASCDEARPGEDAFAYVVPIVRRHAIAMAYADLTRPRFGIPVAKAVAPQLTLFPAGDDEAASVPLY